MAECIRLATADCIDVVELGCGFGDRLQLVKAATRIGVDAHEPYITEARRRYPDMAGDFIVREAGDYVSRFIGRGFRFGAVLMIDFLEHLTRDDARALLDDCKQIASRIVLYVPLGRHPQTTDAYGMGGDHWQTHRSTWEAVDLMELEFDVKVWPTAPSRPVDPWAAFCIWEPCPTPPSR